MGRVELDDHELPDDYAEGIDLTRLVEGTRSPVDTAHYNAAMKIAGVPRPYWDIKPNDVAFRPFKQRPYMMQKTGEHAFPSKIQLGVFENLLASIAGYGANELTDYDGTVFSIVSDPTDHMAKCIAAVVVKTYIRYRDTPRIRWVDAAQFNRWGRPLAPEPQHTVHLTVVTGVLADPTKELRESVRRWTHWSMTNDAITLLVGWGADPVDLPVTWYGVRPNRFLFGFGATRRVQTVG